MDEVILRQLIEQHFRFTGSERAKALLADWTTARRKFVKVFPTEYKRALGEMYAKEQEARTAAAKRSLPEAGSPTSTDRGALRRGSDQILTS